MYAQPTEHHLEQMGSDAGIVGSGVLLSQVHILQGKSIQTDGLSAEQRWVFQQRFGTHDAVDVGLRQTARDVCEPIDASVGHHRDGQRLLYFADDLPVAAADLVLVLLLGAPVHSEQTAAGLRDALRQRQRPLLVLQNPDLAEDGHLDVLDERLHDLLDEFGLLQQVGPVVPLASDALRTAQVDVDRVHLPLQHLGRPHHRLRVVAADLRHQRSVLRAGGEVLLLVVLGRSHHLRMQHGRVAEIGGVTTREQAEGQFRLLHHRCADEQRIVEKGQRLGGGLLVLMVGLFGLHLQKKYERPLRSWDVLQIEAHRQIGPYEELEQYQY